MLSFLHYQKYSDSTLMGMTKKELIEQIHCLLHNWRNCAEEKENAEKLLKEEMKKNTWIRTKDELPKINQEVLLIDYYNPRDYCYFIGFQDGKKWHFSECYTADLYEFSHWQPLSKP